MPVNSPFDALKRARAGRVFVAVAALALGFCLTACNKAGPPPVVLAQVDQARLTLDEVRESFPPEYEKVLSREQYLDFIQRWIDDEVVYQQALKMKLDQDPTVRRKLDELRRKALIEELLERETANQEFEPDSAAMERYYEMHKDEFRRKTPEFRYLHIRVNSLKDALALRAKVRGDNFAALAAGSSLDSSGDDASSFRKPDEIPACLVSDISGAKPGWLSPPINCPDGVYLVQLLDRVEAGSPIPLAEAKEDISGQLVMDQKDKMREEKIRQYKEGVVVNVNLDLIPGQENMPEKTGPDSVPPEGNSHADSAPSTSSSPSSSSSSNAD